MKLTDFTRDILLSVSIKDNIVYLPSITLTRDEYTDVDKALSLMGGKWNRKAKGHVFDHDPTEEIRNAICESEVPNRKKELQFFPTPLPVAQMVCQMACITEESVVLEPSCGNGALADVAWTYNPKALVGVEINPDMKRYLQSKPYETHIEQDFLQYNQPNVFDRIVMNPPFSKHQDIAHVQHAYTMLKPGGILVSVISVGGMIHSDAKSKAFRDFLTETEAELVPVEAGAFKESGTMVPTYIIRIHKPI